VLEYLLQEEIEKRGCMVVFGFNEKRRLLLHLEFLLTLKIIFSGKNYISFLEMALD
jgi:hypothetical protein